MQVCGFQKIHGCYGGSSVSSQRMILLEGIPNKYTLEDERLEPTAITHEKKGK